MVTLGRLGALGHTATGPFHVPTAQVPVRHTHGAGAAFSGGLAHAHLTGAPAHAGRSRRLRRRHRPLRHHQPGPQPRAPKPPTGIKGDQSMTTLAQPDLYQPLTDTGLERPARRHQRIDRRSSTKLAADRTLLGRTRPTPSSTTPSLASLCEHYDILDKIVLHDDPTGWRLRLHVFLDGYFDRPHNHRWTYTSRILTGSYTHTLYGTDHDFTDQIDVAALTPRLVRTEEPGDTYTLHHSMIHSVTAHGQAVTLIVRGPAVKDRFVVTDRLTGKAWWQYGANTESPQAADAKHMSPQHLSECIHSLHRSGVLASQ